MTPSKSNGKFKSKYDWESFGDELVKQYVEGASSVDLVARFNLPYPTLAAYLKRRGVRRSTSASKQLAIKQGRFNTKPKNPRTCRICEESFAPNGPNQQRCRACIPNRRFEEYFSRYGVSKRDWNRILAAQGGTCALCTRGPEHIDHNHKTGVVRGLLCAGCNLAINRVEEPGWSAKAQTYVSTSNTGCRVNESSGYWCAWRADARRKVNKPENPAGSVL